MQAVCSQVEGASVEDLQAALQELSVEDLTKIKAAVVATAPEDKYREPALRDAYKDNCNGINGTPSLVLFMENIPAEEQTTMKDVLASKADEVYKKDEPPHKQDILFFIVTSEPGEDETNLRDVIKDKDTTPLLIVLDLDDGTKRPWTRFSTTSKRRQADSHFEISL
eukprot:TRINITY_DN1979_c0_g2_i2.p1 TRINITY_DN1979_c0_g2~~TRINITY_DN1979_c0_g2_i2.p1  ORF type:complete len:167 (+),score=42.28 TRINITY_DN1979_c0_g2_i2:71-571(+)